MYTLKSTLKRGISLGGALALVVASVIPATSAYADALNPLTERSLTLSSSSPGWDYKDGSGNGTYAEPNSGANGQKTGNTFSFKVSTDTSTSKLKAMTFQYCTTSAGNCLSPGDNGWTGTAGSMTRNADSATSSDLNVVASATAGKTPAEISSSDFGTYIDTTGVVKQVVPADSSKGTFVVYSYNGTSWVISNGWSMSVVNQENGTIADGTATGANNFIYLTNTTGDGFTAGTQVKVVFFGTDDNYITNPGSGAFFVKINTYSDFATGPISVDSANLVDGGVTVANVMNQSIQITTRVLETMDFSVGVVDPNTLTSAELLTSSIAKSTHGVCDPILKGMTPAAPANVLQLGDQNAESSLRTDKTYSTHSYWRLSSNSSAGATVYYSGNTLSNTVNDKIAAIGTTATDPLTGTPQFGLALANGTIADNATGPYLVNYATETTARDDAAVAPALKYGVYENAADNGKTAIDSSTTSDNTGKAAYHVPQLWPLVPATAYDSGAGIVNAPDYGAATDTKFAFDPAANLIPAVLAAESNQVVDCVTAKVRYIGNIAATTPAGIYTTKINYIAAPQY